MKWMLLGFLALAACESRGGAGATTGGLQNTDGGVKLLPGESCGAQAVCTSMATKTYQRCQVSGSPCQARFITSDNQAFNCVSCTDCQAAAGLVSGWCGPGDEQCKDEVTADDCFTCCEMAHKSGSDLYINEYTKCLCSSPGDCAIDCQTDFCDTGTVGDIFCDFCIQSSSCDPTSKCNIDNDCKAYLDCIDTCPAA